MNDAAGAQLDNRDTFLGVGTNRLVRWDQVSEQQIGGRLGVNLVKHMTASVISNTACDHPI